MKINTVTSIRFGEIDEGNTSEFWGKPKTKAYEKPIKEFLKPAQKSGVNLDEAGIKSFIRAIFRIKK